MSNDTFVVATVYTSRRNDLYVCSELQSTAQLVCYTYDICRLKKISTNQWLTSYAISQGDTFQWLTSVEKMVRPRRSWRTTSSTVVSHCNTGIQLIRRQDVVQSTRCRWDIVHFRNFQEPFMKYLHQQPFVASLCPLPTPTISSLHILHKYICLFITYNLPKSALR